MYLKQTSSQRRYSHHKGLLAHLPRLLAVDSLQFHVESHSARLNKHLRIQYCDLPKIMDNRWRSAGIADVTLQAYAHRHGALENSESGCWRPRAKPIALTIVCLIILSLAVYWLIVGPIYESKRNTGRAPRGERNCDG